MKSNLLYKVFAIILSIPLIATVFGGCSGNFFRERGSHKTNFHYSPQSGE